MSRMLPRACAALATVALLAPFSPASAETWTARDARGDVHGYTYISGPTPEDCPTFSELDGSADTNDDITRLAVRHSRTTIVVSVRFRELDPALEQSLALRVRSPAHEWTLDVDRSEQRRGKFRTSVSLYREPKTPDLDEIDPDGDGCDAFGTLIVDQRCPGAHAVVDLDRNVITATLPRTCVRSPRWIRVGAGSSGYQYLDPPSDHPDQFTFNGYDDFWAPDSAAVAGWPFPVGPRIRVRPGVVS